ncbi:MAG TPA: hypothetical protein VHD56_15495 [Tepidisphaeraceae bacterium]|nr:hypothetical protein [Tepidisphaeraceae bacterium]
MQSDNNVQNNDQIVAAEKRPYVRPELTNHGNVEVTTQGYNPSQIT